jgi:glycosyltransferase involved in cell wall biosynthesis
VTTTQSLVSIIIPAKNEAGSLPTLLGQIHELQPTAEIIVIDDGSTDDTVAVAEGAGINVIKQRYSMGNGAAIKTGARAARGEVLVFMDGDGQHRPEDIAVLLKRIAEGYDMAIATRDADAHASLFRRVANTFYNRLASWLTGRPVLDLTSGFRAAKAEKFREFLALLPNGFSYPTTSTMAFLRSGYGVAFEPVVVLPRLAGTKSHIRPLRDGGRFFLIIFKMATLYSPLKIFAPLSGVLFAVGWGYYAFTYFTEGRFTNFGGVLLLTSVLIFAIGLLSEQITMLLYRK